MSVSIANLNLNPVEPLDLSEGYADAARKGTFQLPKAGRYVVRAPEAFPETAFGATRNGDLSVQIDPTIVGPTNEGFNIRFQRVTTKTFERNGTKVSFVGDYLRANGVEGRIPTDPQEVANLIAGTANNTYEVDVDWEARHSPTGYTVKGMKNFPSDGNGGFQSWVEHPTEKDGEGKALRLRANITIRRFVPRT